MKLNTPRWWYVREGAPSPVVRTLLKPLSWLWAGATARRMARTVPVDAGVSVIWVGSNGFASGSCDSMLGCGLLGGASCAAAVC